MAEIRAVGAVVLLAAGAAACAAPDSGPGSVAVSDSAGVRIVSHPAGPFSDTVALEPVRSIGREGDPDYELFRVRQVTPLASGNVVVTNGGTSELLFYRPDGTFLRRVGGPGEGPSEFGFLSTIWHLPADTMVVLDTGRRRLVYFDSAGTLARGESFNEDLTTADPTSTCVFPGVRGLLDDGTRLTAGWGCMQFEGVDGVRPTMATLELVHGERHDTVARINTNDVWERADGRGPDSFDLIPFTHVMGWEAGGDRVFLSRGIEFSVSIYDATAALTEIYREEAVPPTVTAADRDLLRAEREADGFPLADDAPFPERFGAYDRLIRSHEGELWARWAVRPSEDWVRWTVYSVDGTTVRRLVLPKIDVRAVRGGYVYGLTEDDLGIETVVVLEPSWTP